MIDDVPDGDNRRDTHGQGNDMSRETDRERKPFYTRTEITRWMYS